MYKEYRISEIGEVVGGGTPSTSNEAYWGGDIPWITPKDLANYNSVYISKGQYSLTEEGLRSGTRILPRDTVLFTSRAPIGYVAIAQNKIATNQGFKSIICDEKKCHHLYLYYFLKSNLSYIKLFGSGATFPEISGSVMKKIKINIIADVAKQKKIASILSTYDDLIEKNNRKIAILQEMAEEIYKEWFVRFRFPGYKTAKFKDGIPERWKYRPFGEIVTCERGISYSSEEIDCEDGVNLINLKNINAYGGFRLDGTKKYNGKYKNNQVVQCGDLVMGVTDMTQDRRTVGAVALIPPFDNTCVISADLIKVVSHIDNIFIYCLCKYGYYSKFFSQFANGSNVLHLKPSSLKNQKVLIPTEELINKFVKIVKPINDTINNLNRQNDTLTQQRDLLLPRLMSGKLEVKA